MKKLLLFIAIVLCFGQIKAQKNSVWNQLDPSRLSGLTRVRENINTDGELYYTINVEAIKQVLANAPAKFTTQNGVIVSFPNMNGELERYQIWENSNFVPNFQALYPQIRAYVGKGISDTSASINFSVSPSGIQTMVLRPEGKSEFIEAYDKNATAYILFDAKNRNTGKLPFNCSTRDMAVNENINNSTTITNRSSAMSYKTMRLALSCTAEYSQYFQSLANGTDVVPVLAAMNATMTRVNGIYEKDLAVHLNMIANTSVIYFDPATDPYDANYDFNTQNWNYQLQPILTTIIGEANYDIGHLFGATGGGGNAGCIGCVCDSPASSTSLGKGSGITSPGNGGPEGDSFDIDFVAHEMGHQLGGTHCFSYSYEGSGTQVEPGSGTTIMGYAGVTASYDVQPNSDALFGYRNINQIQNNLNPKTCPVSVVMTDNVPVVNAGLDYTIPKGTAFLLTGTATDADSSDVLTHVWEQNDNGNASTVNASSLVVSTKTNGPIFRSFPATTSTKRYMPQLSRVLAGAIAISTASTSSNSWESVSTIARALNFAFTARDNHPGGGQTKTDFMKVTVNATVGPLAVTSQNTNGINWQQGTAQTITWTGFDSSTLTGASTVDILLCTNSNSGNNATFTTVLATAVPNNGSATITVPTTVLSTTCRIMIKATNNIFFAVNSKNFSIIINLANETFGLANFNISPNPNKGNFNVQFDSTSNNDINISVYDLRGRSIFEKQYSNTGLFSQNLQLENVQSGMYIVNVRDGDKKVVKKIIVE